MRRARQAFRLIALALALAVGLAWALGLRFASTPAPAPLPALTGSIDHILIEKQARQMTVFRDGQALRTYPIALGFQPLGDKLRQGDGRTPEGRFRIDRRNAGSAFHLSLGLDYPHPDDRARAAAGGYDPGGDIFIHGQPNALPGGLTLSGDWTAGCVAVSNADMQELWRVTQIGTEVEIRP